jgi:amino acid adenylation domain-containing protein
VADLIPRQPAGQDVFPLSFAQQRFWFLTQVAGPSAAYNVTELHRLRGPVSIEALERSLNEIVRRHAVLRTRFEVVDGVPHQHVTPSVHVPLTIEDLRGLPEAEREEGRRRAIAQEAHRPWSLGDGPPIRARLWRLGDEDHQLMVLMHHIVSDGWSQGVLIRELAVLYDAFSQGRPSPLPELPIQYADFSVWQREWVGSGDFERQLASWRQAMADPPVLQLPAIRTETGDPGRGTHARFFLSRELSAGVRALCQHEGVTVFMAMLAAFAGLLARYSGQDDVVIGTPVANRDRPELEGLIGSFMNPLPIRIDLRGNPSFRVLLARSRETALAAFANQNVPFDVLVRSLATERTATSSPLFQAMFLLQNFGLHSLQVSEKGLAAKSFASLDDMALPADFEHPGDLMYPVALEILEVGTVLGGCLEYAPEYAAILSPFPGHLRRFLAAALENPDARIGDLPLLADDERARLLVEWNHERTAAPARCVHRLFEAECAAHPLATAVICGDEQVTYGQLNARANAIAESLRACGAGPETPVGILLSRSTDMIAAVLGVMKSGGAYVPLDPGYPTDRLRFMVEDSGVCVLLTGGSEIERVSEIVEGERAGRCTVLSLDSVGPWTGEGNVDGGVAAANLAYIIYTSGSTGLPKGTMVTHGSLANAYGAWEAAYQLRSLRVHLQLASLSFDVCTGDLVRALCSGAALLVVGQETLFTPARLYETMRRHQVDAGEFVPVVLRELVKYLEETGESLTFMKLLVAGSDSWYVHEYDRIRQLCSPRTRLVNSYGLTEATIDSTYFDGSGQVGSDAGLVPLGRAFVNTEILLLDSGLRLVPAGVPAELCIGGPALARGYLHRPDVTAERFVPHPFSSAPGARLYRTGDLARYLPDGTLELMGRIDNQVKLRGFRIELPEIESVLRGYEAVREAAVVIREDEPGDRRLVAYVVVSEAGAPAVSDLRRFLRELLPDYMVPSAIVPLAALPVSPNGKIDRSALPPPGDARQLDEAYVAPGTALERRLAELWCGILRLEQVGIHDNFFDLGGHSLLLIQLHARLVAALEREITVVDLFRFPTISALAAHLSRPPKAAPAFAAVEGRAERQRAAVRLRRRQAAQSRDVRETA